VSGVVAWHSDRLHRCATELEEFVTMAEAHRLQIQRVTSVTVDLTTPSGRMVARMLGASAWRPHPTNPIGQGSVDNRVGLILDTSVRAGLNSSLLGPRRREAQRGAVGASSAGDRRL
jgi:hypothetical protein